MEPMRSGLKLIRAFGFADPFFGAGFKGSGFTVQECSGTRNQSLGQT